MVFYFIALLLVFFVFLFSLILFFRLFFSLPELPNRISEILYWFITSVLFFILFLMYFFSIIPNLNREVYFFHLQNIFTVLLVLWISAKLPWIIKLTKENVFSWIIYLSAGLIVIFISITVYQKNSLTLSYVGIIINRFFLILFFLFWSIQCFKKKQPILLWIYPVISFFLFGLLLALEIFFSEAEDYLQYLNTWFMLISALQVFFLVIKNRLYNQYSSRKTTIGVPELYKPLVYEFNISPRELEILLLLTKGLTYKKIGQKLFISYSTVKAHVYNGYKKLNISNKIELTHFLTRFKSEKIPK